VESDIKLLNYFSILDLDAFFPKIINGWWSDLISILIMAAIFAIILLINRKKSI
jgi:hypothetical protein